MKTKKEILRDYLDDAVEALVKIEISNKYLQNRYAQDNNQKLLEELAKLEANKRETELWKAYIEEQIKNA